MQSLEINKRPLQYWSSNGSACLVHDVESRVVTTMDNIDSVAAVWEVSLSVDLESSLSRFGKSQTQFRTMRGGVVVALDNISVAIKTAMKNIRLSHREQEAARVDEDRSIVKNMSNQGNVTCLRTYAPKAIVGAVDW